MSFPSELRIYVGRVREFTRLDWLVYVSWVGLMLGLVASTGGFLLAGRTLGVAFPAEAWLVPGGSLVFMLAIAIDTIGHRTIYKQALARGEALVHRITIFAGAGSCILLCAAYPRQTVFALPALVLTIVSFVYSLVDEALHWHRYLSQQSDVVEMWSHVFILVGHGTMMAGWWRWYVLGYPGVAPTLTALGWAA
jgi:hypothetical protein